MLINLDEARRLALLKNATETLARSRQRELVRQAAVDAMVARVRRRWIRGAWLAIITGLLLGAIVVLYQVW